MPIVIYHDSGQLVGDLASNVGAFKTQEVYQQQALQQQELAMRQQQQQASQDRYNDQNSIRQQQVNQQGQLGQGRLDNAQSLEQQREAAKQEQIAQQTDAMGRVHEGDNQSRDDRQSQRLDYQQGWHDDTTGERYYHDNQQNQLGNDRLGFDQQKAVENQYQFDSKMDAQKTRWAAQVTRDPTQQLALRQQVEHRIAGNYQSREESRAREFEITQLDHQSRDIDAQLKADPYGPNADALRASHQAVQGTLHQKLAEYQNFYMGHLNPAAGGDFDAGDGSFDAGGAAPPPVAPMAAPAQATPAQPAAAPPQQPMAGRAIAQQGASQITSQAVLQARQIKDQAHAQGVTDPAVIRQLMQTHMHPALVSALGG